MGLFETEYGNEKCYLKNDKFIVAIDGEISNRSKLLTTLDLPEESRDDAIVAGLYEKYSLDGFYHLEGTVNLIFYDIYLKTSLLYRSILTGNPLYYIYNENQLAVSTHPTLLLCDSNKISKELSFNRISKVFSFGTGYLCETVFKDISTVRQGELVVITDKSIEKVKQAIDKTFSTYEYQSEKETIQTYKVLLEKAVRKHIKADIHKYGIMLSSGTDSGSIAVVASKILREYGSRLRAYSWTFSDDSLREESQKIQELCDRHDIPLTLFNGDNLGPFDALENLYLLPETPYVNPFYPLMTELYRIASLDGITRMFNGNYADLMFPSRQRLFIDSLQDKRFDLFASYLFESLKKNNGWKRPHKIPEIRGLIGAFISKRHNKLANAAEWLTPEAADTILACTQDTRIDLKNVRFASILAPCYTDSLGLYRSLPGCYGIERIEPHRDIDLLSFAASIPSYMGFRDGQNKYFARESMKGMLPESIRTQPIVDDLSQFIKRSFNRNIEEIRERLLGDSSSWSGYVKEEWMRNKLKNGFDSIVLQDIFVIWLCLNMKPWQKAIESGNIIYDGGFYEVNKNDEKNR